MFPADSLNAQYIEEQSAKYAAKRLAQTQAAEMQKSATLLTPASATSTPGGTRPTTPANLTVPQKTTGLLGNIFQGLVKATAYDFQERGYKSASVSPACEKSELEAFIAEKKRDADICAMPTW